MALERNGNDIKPVVFLNYKVRDLLSSTSFPSLLPADKEEREETGEESDDDDEEEDEDDTEVKEENGVVILTDGNFETFMEGKDTVLVEFYAPW